MGVVIVVLVHITGISVSFVRRFHLKNFVVLSNVQEILLQWKSTMLSWKILTSFKDLGALPVKVDYGESVTAQVFMQNNASWHNRCHQKFNTSMLKRTKKGQKRKGSSDEGHTACRPKRKPNSMSTNCIFCGDVTTELLHEFTTFNMDKAIRDMANEMSDMSKYQVVLTLLQSRVNITFPA